MLIEERRPFAANLSSQGLLEFIQQADGGFDHLFPTTGRHTRVDRFIAAFDKCFLGWNITRGVIREFDHDGCFER